MSALLLLEQGGGLLLEQGGHLLLEQQQAQNVVIRDSAIPEIVVDSEQHISMTVSRSNTTLTDESNTYNQATFTYNQAGVHYGGISQIDTSEIPVIDSIIDY